MKLKFAAVLLMALAGLLLAIKSGIGTGARQVSAQDIPKADGYVTDAAGVLSASDKQKLVELARRSKAERDTEIGVLIVETTGAYPIAEYATKVARQWGVGSKQGEHRGLLFVLATRDRKNFITPSRHLEGDFPDAVCLELAKTGRKDFAAAASGDPARWGPGVVTVVTNTLARVESLSKQQQQTPLAYNPEQPADEGSGAAGWILVLLFVIASAVGVTFLARRYRRRAEEAEKAELARARERERVRRARDLSGSTEPRSNIGHRSTYDVKDDPSYNRISERPRPRVSTVRPAPSPPARKAPSKPAERRESSDDSPGYSPLPSTFDWGSSSSPSSPSSSSSSSSSSSDSGWGSSSSSSDSFGGGGDFGGGGGGDSF